MYYDKATLERDIAKINSRYVAYDGAYIHCNKLKMCDPAAKLILSLAVETDDYFSLLSSPANLLTNDRG